MKKIEKLTPEQEAAMPCYVDKWIKIGTDTKRLDYDRTVDIIHAVQENLLKKPKTPVAIFKDPVECWVACNLIQQGCEIKDLANHVTDYFNGNKIQMDAFSMPYLTGSFDAHIFAFYDFFKHEVNLDFKEFDKNYEIWKSTTELGMIFPLDNICIVCEKPSIVKLNENRAIHCDGGPAVQYEGRGEISIFALNGVVVPEWLAVTPSSKIEISQYNSITNADVRMEFVRKVGIERMLETGKLIDSFKNYDKEWWTKSQYELWDMHHLFQGINYAPHVKMVNQTTNVFHVEAVSPNCRTLCEAIQERLGDRDLDIQKIA
jgi:hypothetical protein